MAGLRRLLAGLRRARPRRRQRRAEPPAAADPRHLLGMHGERLAEQHLRAFGLRCTARRLRTRYGEIDLLVRRRRLWVAVEVKTRRRHPAPELLVDDPARHRLLQALLALAPALRPRPRTVRVDVVAVRIGDGGDAEILHFPGQAMRVPRPGAFAASHRPPAEL